MSSQYIKNKNCRKRKRNLIEQLKADTGCQDCGTKENLTFHHRNPSTKIDSVSNLVNKNCSVGKLKREIDKCDIICRSCHDGYHNGKK